MWILARIRYFILGTLHTEKTSVLDKNSELRVVGIQQPEIIDMAEQFR
jgi:hypothetical protein